MGEIGKFILFLRKERGLSQAALGRLLCVDETTVSKWERGKGYPDVSLFPALSKVFDVSIDELMQGYRNPKRELLGNEQVITEAQKAAIIKEATRLKLKKLVKVFVLALAIIYVLLSAALILYNGSEYANNAFMNNRARLYYVDKVHDGNRIDGFFPQTYKVGDVVTLCIELYVPSYDIEYEINSTGDIFKYSLEINGEERRVDFGENNNRLYFGGGAADDEGFYSYVTYIMLPAEECGQYVVKPYSELRVNGRAYSLSLPAYEFTVVAEYSDVAALSIEIVEAETEINSYESSDFLVRPMNISNADMDLALVPNKEIGYIVFQEGMTSAIRQVEKHQVGVPLAKGESLYRGFSYNCTVSGATDSDNFTIRAYCIYNVNGAWKIIYSDDVTVTKNSAKIR